MNVFVNEIKAFQLHDLHDREYIEFDFSLIATAGRLDFFLSPI